MAESTSHPSQPSQPKGPTPRRTFGVSVLAGLAGGVLAAVAGNRSWVEAGSADGLDAALLKGIADSSAPSVTALALVVLAAWGVLLVTRGRFRLAIAWLGLLVGVLLVAAAVISLRDAPDALREALHGRGLDAAGVHHTAWGWLALVGAVLAVGAGLAAVRFVRGWPEMGRRYDAPGGADTPASGSANRASDAPGERTPLDLWRALDDGQDPTALDSER